MIYNLIAKRQQLKELLDHVFIDANGLID
jgi:hypothetical protein